MLQRLRRLAKTVLTRPDPALADLSPGDRALVKRICDRNLTYLSAGKLKSVVQTCRSLEDRNVPGLFIEAGCALGGSAILIASIKRPARPLRAYDVFGMIPPPTEMDTPDVHSRYKTIVEGKSKGLGGDRYYGYEKDLYAIVENNFRSFGIDLRAQRVSLIKGLVQDTLRIDEPVAFAHIDVDWYDPVRTCLERIVPQLAEGGSIILDDYHNWGGCRKATDEFLEGLGEPLARDDSAGSMKLTRADT